MGYNLYLEIGNGEKLNITRNTIVVLITHQQMHFLLNLEKFKFIVKYT